MSLEAMDECLSWEPDTYIDLNSSKNAVTIDFCPAYQRTHVFVADQSRELSQGTCKTTFTDLQPQAKDFFVWILPVCPGCERGPLRSRFCDKKFKFGPYNFSGEVDYDYHQYTDTRKEEQHRVTEPVVTKTSEDTSTPVVYVGPVLVIIFLVVLLIMAIKYGINRHQGGKGNRRRSSRCQARFSLCCILCSTSTLQHLDHPEEDSHSVKECLLPVPDLPVNLIQMYPTSLKAQFERETPPSMPTLQFARRIPYLHCCKRQHSTMIRI